MIGNAVVTEDEGLGHLNAQVMKASARTARSALTANDSAPTASSNQGTFRL
jgi:hypothetical protein